MYENKLHHNYEKLPLSANIGSPLTAVIGHFYIRGALA
jgi:hypothetical protein